MLGEFPLELPVPPCRARVRLQAHAVLRAFGMPSETLAKPFPLKGKVRTAPRYAGRLRD